MTDYFNLARHLAADFRARQAYLQTPPANGLEPCYGCAAPSVAEFIEDYPDRETGYRDSRALCASCLDALLTEQEFYRR